jgi:hypothetical protein
MIRPAAERALRANTRGPDPQRGLTLRDLFERTIRSTSDKPASMFCPCPLLRARWARIANWRGSEESQTSVAWASVPEVT